jgi:hypothetical protein
VQRGVPPVPPAPRPGPAPEALCPQPPLLQHAGETSLRAKRSKLLTGHDTGKKEETPSCMMAIACLGDQASMSDVFFR